VKKLLIIFLVLAILGGGGYLLWTKVLSKAARVKKEPFVWGVTMRPHALGRYNQEVWAKEIALAKGLGVNYVRVGWQYDAWINGKEDQFGFQEEIFKSIQDAGMNVYLVFEGNPDVLKVSDPYYDGYNNAFQIASHNRGKIKYYQLLNEAGSAALKGGEFSGDKESDYDAEKYTKVSEWLKGAARGIKEADPSAYRIISDQWVHTAFFDMLQRDKVDYDIIGWDWFSDMGLMGERKLTDGTLLIDKLKTFNKPIFLAEVNQRPEGDGGQKGMPEEKQADFIGKMAEWAYNSGAIRGFLVLELTDVSNTGANFTDYYGLVEAAESSAGVGIPGKPRQAYDVYKKIISKYPAK